MIDMQGVRVAALNNRVPGAVLAVEVISAAVALALLAFYLAILGRGVFPVLSAAALICLLLVVTLDLDRPTRGLIRVPSTPLTSLRASMDLAPAAAASAIPGWQRGAARAAPRWTYAGFGKRAKIRPA
ncbi:MAG: hypothetical protein ACJ755_04140 [Gaiellaceae bacterium]